MKKENNSKKMLFEAMHKVTGMPLNEESYSDHLDTNYSADGMDDHNADNKSQQEAEELYDTGQKLFSVGKKEEAEKYRQEALKKSSFIGWGETELPPYNESEINEDFEIIDAYIRNYLPDDLKDSEDAKKIVMKIIELLDLINDPAIDQSEGGISDKMREMAIHMINTNR